MRTSGTEPESIEIRAAVKALPKSLATQATLALGTSALLALCLQAVGILMVRSLGITERGQVAAAVLVPTILAYLGQLGIPPAVGFWITKQPARRAQIIGTSRALAVMISIAFMALSVFLTLVVPLDPATRVPAIIFALFIPLNLLAPINSAVLQADMRSKALNTLRMVNVAVYLILVVLSIWLGIANTLSMVLAQLCGYFVWMLVSFALVPSETSFAFDGETARSLISYGARAHLGTVAPVDTLRIDQLVLGLFLSTYSLGIYVVALAFVTLNRLIGVSVGLVAFPFASGRIGNRKATLYTFIVGAFLLTSAAAVIEIVFGRELLSILFGIESTDAYHVLVILATASIFMSTRQVVSDILRGLGRPGLPALSELILISVMGIASFAFWDRGLVGVAVAVALSTCISLLFLLACWLMLVSDVDATPTEMSICQGAGDGSR